MGAYSFTTISRGADIAKAFETATSEARYEFGSGGYTGTIAEKGDYRIHHTPRPLMLEEATELADELTNSEEHFATDKWGPAGALALASVKPTPDVRTFEITVTLDGRADSWLAPRRAARSEIERGKLLLAPSQFITGIEQTSATPAVRYEVERSQEGSLLRYVVTNTTRNSWKNGFDSLDDAIAYVSTFTPDSWAANRSTTHEISGVLRDLHGNALVTVERRVELVNYTMTVRVGELPASTETVGWLFFGYASS